jgi:hypothetical protein
MRNKQLPTEAVGLQIGRLKGDDLVMCEAMRFPNGRAGVELVLRRAAISGRVEIEGEIEDHLADVLDDNGDIIATVALDRRSYSAIKNRWMRCKVERHDDH